jgi:hypothetical protein
MANIKQGSPKGSAGKAEVVAREAEIIKLRRGGLTYDMIAEKMGYASASVARQAYQRGMERYVAPDVNEIRQLESERLDIAQAAIWQGVLSGDNQSVANLIKIMERRAKLFGLDAPKELNLRAEVITYDRNSIDGEVQRLVALLDSSSPRDVDTQLS